jgi:hypothetical protein
VEQGQTAELLLADRCTVASLSLVAEWWYVSSAGSSCVHSLIALDMTASSSWRQVTTRQADTRLDIVTCMHACLEPGMSKPRQAARYVGWNFHHSRTCLCDWQDDMELSPDFFSYFEAAAPILDTDPSLYCVSSWNDHGQVALVCGVSSKPSPCCFFLRRSIVLHV